LCLKTKKIGVFQKVAGKICHFVNISSIILLLLLFFVSGNKTHRNHTHKPTRNTDWYNKTHIVDIHWDL